MEIDFYNEDDERYALVADVALAYNFDPGFRSAINAVDLEDEEALEHAFEVKNKLLEACEVQDGDEPAKMVDRWIGRVSNMQTKSPIRKEFLRILRQIKKTVPQVEVNSSPVVRRNEMLSSEEKKAKTRAKEFYGVGNYEKARDLVLLMLAKGPHLSTNSGILGFLMHCYNKLKDYPNALKYAEKLMALDISEMHFPPTLGVAALAAYKMGNFKKALFYAKRVWSYEMDDMRTVRMIAYSCYQLGLYDEAVDYFTILLKGGEVDDVFACAVVAAHRAGKGPWAKKFAKALLKVNPRNPIANRYVDGHF